MVSSHILQGTLPLKHCNIKYLNESTCFEVAILNMVCNLIIADQSCDKFENIISDLDLTLGTLTQKNQFLKSLLKSLIIDMIHGDAMIKRQRKESNLTIWHSSTI